MRAGCGSNYPKANPNKQVPPTSNPGFLLQANKTQ